MLDENSVPPHEQTTLRDNNLSNAGGTVWPPPPRPRGRQQTFPNGVAILMAILAVILIVAGLGFIVYATTTQYKSALHAEATTQALSTARAKAQAQQVEQATAQALATQQANIYATATAITGSTATAQVGSNNASATATALQNVLTQDTSGTPTFNDMLSDNTGNNQWDEIINSEGNTGCQFNNGAYHALEPLRGFLQPCFAGASNFSSFVYQVTMIIDNGDQGGLIFRANSAQTQYYLFRIGVDGSYTLELYNKTRLTTLSNGFNTAITTGVGQSNTLSVIADHHTFYLFANQTYIASASDATLTSGQIGVVALDFLTPTGVEFSNAQVWTL